MIGAAKTKFKVLSVDMHIAAQCTSHMIAKLIWYFHLV
jgi:hypothetical protein